MEMTQVELFNKFKEDHRGINMSITTFVQKKPWYVRPITIRAHVVVVIMCNFNYIMTCFLNLVKCFGQIHHLHPQYVNSYLKLYVREIAMKYFIIRNVSMENIIMVVEILFYSTINTLLVIISRFQM